MRGSCSCAGDVCARWPSTNWGSSSTTFAADRELAECLGVVPEDQAGEVVDGRLRRGCSDEGDASSVEVERPRILFFRDVGGMDALKEEIALKIIYPLQHPEMYRAYGKEIGGGILMYGPPGCGKTHLARATAGEIKAGFIAVGISDVLDMWIGRSERNLRPDQRGVPGRALFFDEVTR